MFVEKAERVDEPQTLFSVTICPLNIYVFLKYLDMSVTVTPKQREVQKLPPSVTDDI